MVVINIIVTRYSEAINYIITGKSYYNYDKKK